MHPLSKRGMSPLIATVLLMAFAVALGGMVMNWQGSLSGLDCSDVHVDVTTFCFDGQYVQIAARNTGEEPVASLLLQIDHPASGQYNITVSKSAMDKGTATSSQVPITVDNDAAVNLFANLDRHGKPTACPEPIARKLPLPKC